MLAEFRLHGFEYAVAKPYLCFLKVGSTFLSLFALP